MVLRVIAITTDARVYVQRVCVPACNYARGVRSFSGAAGIRRYAGGIHAYPGFHHDLAMYNVYVTVADRDCAGSCKRYSHPRREGG